MKYLVLFITGIALSLSSCKPEAKPIEYGNQSCDYCRMSIVDERYAAQLLSSKGKTYSFDAIECMINYKNENTEEWHQQLVTDYNTPTKLIPAEGSWILRSKKLPSPMGMYLTAVPNKEEAEKLQNKKQGTLYPYEEVAGSLDNLPAL